MDIGLLDIIEDGTPRINDDLASGVATLQLHDAEAYVDRDLRASSEQFPPGLVYEGYKRCTFQEEYQELMRKRDTIYIELAQSDFFMVKYLFSYHGQMLEPRFMYLPFSEEANLHRIRGTPYMLSPVLADIAISVTLEGLFVPLSLAKVQFMRLTHHFRLDGEAKTVYVAHSNLYRRSKKSKAVKLNSNSKCSTLVHYMLCTRGLQEVMADFFNCPGVVAGYAEEINAQNYPASEWAIISSAMTLGNPPVGNRNKQYIPSKLCLAVPRASLTSTVLDALGAVFYVIDQFPERVKPDYVEHPRLWQSLMGHVLFGDEVSENERYSLVQTHLEGLDAYVNFQSRRTLHQGNVLVDDIYELFGYVIAKMPEMIINASTTVASLYDKRLMILRYLLSNISYAIYKLMFRLRVQANKKKDRLSVNDILDSMRKGLHRDLIASVTGNHTEVTPVSSPGDNKVFKITGNMVLQEDTDTSRKRGTGSLEDPSKFLHASVVEVASYCAMSKNEPTGRNKPNMFMHTSPRHDVLRNPQHVELLDWMQDLIQR